MYKRRSGRKIGVAFLAAMLAVWGLGASTASAQTPCGAAPAGANVIISDDAMIMGTPGPDFICAGASDNTIHAGGGDDVVYGRGGNDSILGQNGDDDLRGGAGDDMIGGGRGLDRVLGGGGNDTLSGGGDDDDVRGGPGDDGLFGGAGDDVLRGHAGVDLARGGAGTDNCSAETAVACELPNTAPVAVDDMGAVDFNGNVMIDLLANDTDADGDPLSIDSVDVTGTLGAVVADASSVVTYETNGAFTGLTPGTTTTDAFNYTVIDGKGGTDTGLVVVTIARDNDPPMVTPLTLTTNENTIFLLDALAAASDPEGFPVTVTSVVNSVSTKGSVFLQADQMVRYDPAMQFEELDTGETDTDQFDVVFEDPHGGMTTATVMVTITGVNDTPVAVDDAYSVGPTSLLTGNVLDNDSDSDGDPLTVVSVNGSPPGVVGEVCGPIELLADGSFSFTPQPNIILPGQSATAQWVYEVSDGNSTATATLSITVLAALC